VSPRAYNLGARSASVAGNRARVVAAARAMFADAGFHRVSLDAVAARADVARATVYGQFGSKAGLLAAVVTDFEDRAGLAALAGLVETAAPDRLVRDVVTAGCAYWATDPPLARAIIAFTVTDPAAADLLAGHDAGRLRLLTRVTGRLADAGLLAAPPERALDTLWLVTGFAAYDELARGRSLPTAKVAELLAGIAEARVLGSGAREADTPERRSAQG
jgi:AcrR family transcriptional regulator